MFRVVVILPHPTPYRSPMFDAVARRADFDLQVWYCEGRHPERPWDPAAFQDGTSSILPGRRYRLGSRSVRWNPGIWKRLTAVRPDIVFLGGYTDPTMLAAALWCKWHRCEYGFVWESHRLTRRPWWVRALKAGPMRVLVGPTSANLPTGSAAGECLIHYGVNPDALFYFPNTCDAREIDSKVRCLRQDLRNVRASLGLEDGVIVLFAGRFVASKNPLSLVAAWKRVEELGLNAQLVLLGDGPLRRELEDLSTDLGLQHIVFPGFVQPDKTIEYYAAADIFVLASLHETWGAVIPEAMAASLAIVASRWVGSVPDLVREGINGYVLSKADSHSVANALSRLIRDKELRQAMGARSLDLIQEWDFRTGVANFLKAVDYARSRVKQNG